MDGDLWPIGWPLTFWADVIRGFPRSFSMYQSDHRKLLSKMWWMVTLDLVGNSWTDGGGSRPEFFPPRSFLCTNQITRKLLSKFDGCWLLTSRTDVIRVFPALFSMYQFEFCALFYEPITLTESQPSPMNQSDGLLLWSHVEQCVKSERKRFYPKNKQTWPKERLIPLRRLPQAKKNWWE